MIGMTLLQRCCDCGWERLIRFARRADCEHEIKILYDCPNCMSRNISQHSRVGQYKLSELKELIIREYETNKLQ